MTAHGRLPKIMAVPSAQRHHERERDMRDHSRCSLVSDPGPGDGIRAGSLSAQTPRPAPPERKADRPPNVLLIITDQQRWDTLGYTGKTPCRTPNLDRLAREGVAFDRCLTPCPLCSPSQGRAVHGALSLCGRHDEQRAPGRRWIARPSWKCFATRATTWPIAANGTWAAAEGPWQSPTITASAKPTSGG